MMNSVNYKKQRAPIEKTLERIILNNQPALLMTDFEEYNGGLIQKAAYAKKYFIDWLAKGIISPFINGILLKKKNQNTCSLLYSMTMPTA